MKKKNMKDEVRKIIRESVSCLFENKSIWDRHGENLPIIFKGTIYRLPTVDELKDVDDFNLNSEDICSGFSYTIVGRGILDAKKKELIIKSIKRLSELYPNNENYKKALSDAKK